ncbi:acetylajmalan esterase-like [Mercurialis annua]|uniref:acetylajmalan esterase-like n=1 Tax=Mercurialis annua TaxID=3986 RepID=UPI0024AC96DE|nr:acetylajmalan esterase-like [Mercurialis annua]
MACSAKTLLATVLIWFLHLPYAYTLEPRCLFNRIYQLGDSISDVGNLKRQNPKFGCALPPYGQNFFHKETGRCSNGLLIIDYIAQSARIPFLGAYLNPNAKFEGGVNFAVAGSTALPADVLAKRKIFNPATNNSLAAQLDWMSTYFNTTCYKSSDCTKKLKSSLFMVGEIGGNDYNYVLLQNKTIQDVNSMVPEVVLAIKDAVKNMKTNTIILNVVIVVSLLVLCCKAQDLKACKFDRIYQLGDSLSDTGNSIVELPQAYHARLPYGETIGKATGRASDGYLMIDYIAQSAGLPLLEPYENLNSTLIYGADFSVAGVTALSMEKLLELKLDLGYSNSSLSVQLEWLRKTLSYVCNATKDCQEKLKSSLFVVGIGPNDYSRALWTGGSIDKIKAIMTPVVVQTIKDGIQTMINYGASKIVFAGAYPHGCSPSYLSAFLNSSSATDSFGCLKDYNDVFAHHNDQLQKAFEVLRIVNPNATIIYNDVYIATYTIIENLPTLGFKTYRKACCGIGGEFNVSPGLDKMCGAKGIPVCTNPKEHVFWDGAHFTHQANKVLSDYLIKEMLSKLQCTV